MLELAMVGNQDFSCKYGVASDVFMFLTRLMSVR